MYRLAPAPSATLVLLWIAGTSAALAVQADEGPLRNTTALPSARAAAQSIQSGDTAWRDALNAAGADRAGSRNTAFDHWRAAAAGAKRGDGVPLVQPGGAPDAEGGAPPFPDPGSDHERRAEGVTEGLIRRLAALDDLDRAAWEERFRALSTADLAAALDLARGASGDVDGAAERLTDVERTYPATQAAARAALALFELSLESGRPTAAAAWLDRAARHVSLTPSWSPAERLRLDTALERRRAALQAAPTAPLGQDHATPPRASGAPSPAPAATRHPEPVTVQRISGLRRRSDEPFGLGLSSGIAFFGDGTALIQGAHGVLTLVPTESGRSVTMGIAGPSRSDFEDIFTIPQPLVRTAPSAGGWPSLPATDGLQAALVMGRGKPARSFRDVEMPPTGNALGLVTQGPPARPIAARWVLRDGIVAYYEAPTSTPAAAGAAGPQEGAQKGTEPGPTARDLGLFRVGKDVVQGGGLTDGWDLGRGWEFQPGPVMTDGAIFALARGLGDPSADDSAVDHADEVRLLCIDAADAALIWSVAITKERGLLDGSRRGEAGYYAATTMPLGLDRSTGSLLVGTNSGLLAAYSAADGRLLWAFQNQRRTSTESGWPGTRAPILAPLGLAPAGLSDVGPDAAQARPTAWFAPFDSTYAYALPAGPQPLDGSLLREPPRAKESAIELSAVLPAADDARPSGGSTLVLLGRSGRYPAVLLDPPDSPRAAAAYLAPDERFSGRAALNADGSMLFVAGTAELSGLARNRDFGLTSAALIPSQGAGTGGDVYLRGPLLYVVGRDTVWLYRTP